MRSKQGSLQLYKGKKWKNYLFRVTGSTYLHYFGDKKGVNTILFNFYKSKHWLIKLSLYCSSALVSSLSIHPPTHLSIRLPIHLYIFSSTHYLFIHLSILHQSMVDISINLFIHPFIYSSICLSFIHL